MEVRVLLCCGAGVLRFRVIVSVVVLRCCGAAVLRCCFEEVALDHSDCAFVLLLFGDFDFVLSRKQPSCMMII